MFLGCDEFVCSSDDLFIKIWNISSRKSVFSFLDIEKNKSHMDEINSLIRLPKNRLASGSLDKTIKIWDLDYKKIKKNQKSFLFKIDNLGTCVYSLLYISKYNKDYLVAGCFKDINVYEISDDVKLNSKEYNLEVLKGHTREVTCLKMSHNNTKFVSGSIDTSFIIWNI